MNIGEFIEELREAADWVKYPIDAGPAPDYERLLCEAADYIDAFTRPTGNGPVLAAQAWRTNADLIYDAYRLGYIQGRVLDVTPGDRGLWLRKVCPNGYDAKHLPDELASVTLNHLRHDFRNLPYEDESYDTVLFDPPYKLNGNPDGLAELSQRYGVDVPTRWQDRHWLILQGVDGCLRLIAEEGFLLVKVQDQVCSGKMRWQTSLVRSAVYENHVGNFTQVDEFMMLGHHIPQPMQGRKQKHAHGRPSTLMVFQRS